MVRGMRMADLNAEPSMEDILSSIKRIIAEEGDARPAPVRAPAARDEVLELREPLPAVERPVEPIQREPIQREAPMPISAPVRASAPRAAAEPAAPHPARVAPVVEEPEAAPLASAETLAVTRGALDHLSRMMVKPEPEGDGTLEGLVRELLRPMLRDWLDAHLPQIVETMVAREIERITQAR